MVENLRVARGRAAVMFHEFVLMKDVHEKTLFCCFEGQDSKYYGFRIETYSGYEIQNTHYFDCGGKDQVIRFHDLINKDQTYQNIRIAYFVDLDFDESIKGKCTPEIYETPCYSVENFYTTKDCFQRILAHEFGLNISDDDYKTCLTIFEDRQREFHGAILLLNAWVACQRELYNQGQSQRADLANINLKEFVSINLEKVEAIYNLTDIERVYPAVPKIAQEKLESKKKYLLSKGCQKYFRGKFEIEFLRKMILCLKEEFGSGSFEMFTKKLKIHLAVSQKNILSELSQYADTTECCKQYIQKFHKT